MLRPRFKHKKGLMNKRGLLFLYLGFSSFSFRTGTSFSPCFFALFVAAAAAVFFFLFPSLFFWFYSFLGRVLIIYVYGIYSVDCSLAFFFLSAYLEMGCMKRYLLGVLLNCRG